MAVSSVSLSWASTTLSKKLNNFPCSNELPRPFPLAANCSSIEQSNCRRRLLLLGAGTLATSLLPASPFLAQEIPQNYRAFVDKRDGYSYYYPSDWIDFDFRGHDSAFKDRTMQLQNVRVRFIPTDKKDLHDLGSMQQVVSDLVEKIYAAPNQRATIFDVQERSEDGKNYYTFEYELTSPNFSSVAFATIGISNGRYYTLIVGANERRWKRYRNQLKMVADSFKMLDI
ncbi:photosynthetic NDH subunit of lumenal location 1, chloroplastic [Euphorbia lathyris]|uniref:photosynthetic NDH subunit of lumenal location 1, chloroplastic n=1 Tax=Euphorbia lathyris TaxID=212925 RepID=UPI003313869F